jgi:hypothetical protein
MSGVAVIRGLLLLVILAGCVVPCPRAPGETPSPCPVDKIAFTQDTGWQTVCDLADLPFVRQIVPTWYE